MDKLKKVFSPGHQKDEEVLYGDNKNTDTTTGHVGGEGSHLNQTQPTATPVIGTGKHDTDTDTTSRPAPGVSSHLASASGVADDASTASIRSGVVGSAVPLPSSIGAQQTMPSSTGTEQTLPDRTDERSFPLTSGQNTANTGTLASDTNPLTHHQHEGRGHQFGGDPCPPGSEAPMPGYVHHVPGPHSTDIANRLDPHVPGEFPADDGSERHQHGTSAVPSSTTTGTSAIPSSTNPSSAIPSSTNPSSTRDMTSDPSREHHLGRDAALVGGAGAAGLGAHELASHKHTHDSVSQGIGRYDDQSFDPTTTHSERAKRIPDLMYGSSTTHGQSPASVGHDSNAALGTGAAGVGAAGVGATASAYKGGPTETDPASKTIGPHKSNLANIFDPRVQPDPSKMKSAVNDGPYRREEPEHHYGRDAAMVGGAGAIGAGAYEASHRGGPTATDPASNTIGPHSSNVANIVDPRVQPEPERMKDRTTAGPHNSDTLNRADPRVDSDLSHQQNTQHHYGRDAALAGGTGAAGVGAYEYGKHNAGMSSQVPASSTAAPMGSTTTPMGSSTGPMSSTTAPVGSTTAPHQSGMLNRDVDSTPTQQGQQHHYGRDAALAGGAGAAGVGAYEYGKHDTAATHQPSTGSTTAPTSSATAPHQSGALNRADPRVDSDLTQKNSEHHYGRDAAVVGGTGAAAAYGAHEAIDLEQEKRLEKERLKQAEKAHEAAQKDHEKDLKHEKKDHDKELKHEKKEHEKELKHQEHEREKELKHQQHEREKQIEKDHKLAEKEQEKEQKKAAALAAAAREKSEKQHHHDAEELEKENEKGEKKHGLFGFLKGKDKTKGSDEEEHRRESGSLQDADRLSHERDQRELESGATRGDLHAAGAGNEPAIEQQREQPLASAPQYVSIDDKGHQHISTDPNGRHRLHKEPPASVLKERGLEPSEHS